MKVFDGVNRRFKPTRAQNHALIDIDEFSSWGKQCRQRARPITT